MDSSALLLRRTGARWIALQAALLLWLFAGPVLAQAATASRPAAVYPGASWSQLKNPAEQGWSAPALAEVQQFAKQLGSAAVMVVHGGRVVVDWGETTKHYNVHSIRKSLLSAMVGQAVAEGRIDLGRTLAELGIQDNEPVLTDLERTATVLDLLKARSGVYHPALYETAGMKARRPQRGSHAPGAFWYYNNWDFNALGTIFKQSTEEDVFAAFARRIATPLGMEDHGSRHTRFVRGDDSIHPAYPFRMTARDLARFGLLFARGGKWQQRQVVPAEWVARSTASYSPVTAASGRLRGGYGFMWWTEQQGQHLAGVRLPAGSFSARGAGGHHVLVVPAWDLVVVHRVDTDRADGPRVETPDFGKLVARIVAAMPASVREGPVAAPPDNLPRRLDRLLPQLLAKHRVPGASLVGLERGRIAWERHYGERVAGGEPVSSSTLFEAASMSKPLAAHLALQLVAEGRLDLDRPLRSYLDAPYLPDDVEHELITARMVLTHCTGWPNWRQGGWRSGGPLVLQAPPGSSFTYSGEGFLYLQRVLERISGEAFSDQVERRLLAPLGIRGAGFTWQPAFAERAAAGHDKEGAHKTERRLYTEANAAFTFYCTATDYALFLQQLLAPPERQILPPQLVRAMRTPATEVSGRPAIERGGVAATATHYGLGWVVDQTVSGMRLRHSGSNGTGFRCYCEFDPADGSGLVIMTNGVGGADLWREVLRLEGRP